MSWFGAPDDKTKKDKEEKPTMSKRFFTACLLILGGIIALGFALELLARFWLWLLVIGLVALGAYVAFRVLQARRDRW